MEQHLSEYDIRLAKRQQLIDMGISPYAQQWDKKDSVTTLVERGTLNAKELRSIEDILANPQTPYSTAGRIMLKRSSGKLMFGQLMDETGTIQVMREYQSSKLSPLSKGGLRGDQNQGVGSPQPSFQEGAKQKFIGDSTKPFDYLLADKLLDVGDIIGIRGELFFTHKGELTLFVPEFQLLSKALRPLGDKRHGIGEDNQERAYRQRYLDMIFNEDTLARMKLRSKFVRTLRNFYDENRFIELETPILGSSASGAAARPFITHHNDFDQDMYLRISLECPQKVATVGMLERVFEIGKEFRNEGSDPSHIQEFTGCEHYASYRNYEDNMKFTEQMFDYLFEKVPELSKTIQVIDKSGLSKEVNFQTPRERIDYIAQIKKDSGIDVSLYEAEDETALRQLIKDKGHHREGLEVQTTATMIDYLYKKVTRPKIVGPAFIYNYPKTMQPLARQSDSNPKIVEQRQLLVNGREVIKAYSELVDPVIQQANFDEQAEAVAKGDDEATKGDDDFVKAMEYGMPCQSGRGMGIDRILALLTEQSNIRDVVLFPLMKPILNKPDDANSQRNQETKTTVTLSDKPSHTQLADHKDSLKVGLLASTLLKERNINPSSPIRTDLEAICFNAFKVGKGNVKININNLETKKFLQYMGPKFISDFKTLGLAIGILIPKGKNMQNKGDIDNIVNAFFDLLKSICNENGGNFDDGMVKELRVIRDYSTTNHYWFSLHTYNVCLDQSTIIQSSKQILKENSDSSYGILPTRKKAKDLANKYLTETKLHCEQVAHCMKYFAKKLGKDESEQNYRYMVGLLHDVDRDMIDKDANRHIKDELAQILLELNLEESLYNKLLQDIRSHGPSLSGIHPTTQLQKYLISIDELSGLMYAYARMRAGSFEGMEVSGVMKRIKDLKFAAGVDRSHVRHCETELGISLEDFVGQMIEAFKSNEKQVENSEE